MSFESALTFFIAIFIFGITPGPGVFAILAKSLTQGVLKTLPLSAGMVCGDILYLVMACFGLAAIAQQWEVLFLVIRYVGAAYLLYLGWKMWTSPLDLSAENSSASTRKNGWSAALQGFLISSSNPKVVLFYIAFLPTFMDVTVLDGADIVLASVLAFLALMLGLTLISYSAAQARRLMKSERVMKRVNQGAGGIMAGAGAFLALRG
ncbi:LysE family translocator [Marinomonas ostreistagni]|uniref:LysE family translocator n=1 Tax=Marinomonas ostreistagni TaxID=359209 RepID=A0ABS0Z6A7_9GAMM|nr:LysE family translocator [Marinomonas ostreistagni]MBJ7549197.1 LysE family translocator [Marinomonas ostreistagni]